MNVPNPEFPEQEEEDAALDLDLFDDDLLDAGVTSGGDPAAWSIPGLKEEDEDDDDDDVVDESNPADEAVNGSVTSGGDAAAWGKEQGKDQETGGEAGSKKPD